MGGWLVSSVRAAVLLEAMVLPPNSTATWLLHACSHPAVPAGAVRGTQWRLRDTPVRKSKHLSSPGIAGHATRRRRHPTAYDGFSFKEDSANG